MSLSKLPNCILHADWSLHPDKRQIAAAWLGPDGKYIADAPVSVPDPSRLLPELRARLGSSGCALVGFDFPIGLPLAYAQKAGITHFLDALPLFGYRQWKDFYTAAETPGEISLFRPFYPARPGSAAQNHLLAGLGLERIEQLRRTCEMAHSSRRSAAPIFWTLGGQQVGKAALNGWREVLNPALKNSPESFYVWPFAGEIEDLLQPGIIIAVETYPAEYYAPLGISFSTRRKGQKSGKRSLPDRKLNAEILIERARNLSLTLSSNLQKAIRDGFGSTLQGEDAFDAFVGLLGMIMVVQGELPLSVSLPEPVLQVEGWILGQRLLSPHLKL